ncbi:MAG TPA: ribbon-helix-helix domain-containing protein [Vitreimonas sp.]|uniref:ribbon-helix-helix domain-containing protein n=1 Tax=Vitreimonas sp. TaxID=3069702 RepID=UPI002D381F26|nr:ribbon-helix-helix domain-containing protein [Vitreimonas sp.]HYD88412.1 ribbon-helix-helix domain-containing protein [Vitreimonas sp.]
MVTLTVKLPEALAAKLQALVRRRGQRRSEIVREAIERAVEDTPNSEGPSVHDLLADLKGVVKGPKDLSTNKKYMRGYGE